LKAGPKLLAAGLAAIVTLGGSLGAAGSPPAARVIVLANRDDPDSLRIAAHYAEARGVPRENIIAQAMPLDETITWPVFVATVWQPLQDELVRRRWIDAIPMALTDSVGRKKPAISGHRISYLVVCRGVPLRIAHSAALYAEPPPPQDRPEFRTNEGAVDAELSLLAQTNYPINGMVRNPLYANDRPTEWEAAQVVKVSRLDGPSAEDALALVDRALAAERTGLLGRAYVDLDGSRPGGDHWLEAAAAQLAELGFDLDVDRAQDTFPPTARFDAPVLYFGWYAPDATGPFVLPGFRFPPGAIAAHIHSSSATTLRSDRAGWCGPFVARGVTATVGNVFEPYLGFLHRPDYLLRALARGDTFGDAAYYAEPMLSWQAIAIGDPLYRPFARSFEEQWNDRANLPTPLAGYAALRAMHLLEAGHRYPEAMAAARSAQQTQPNLALSFTLARRQEQAGDLAGAVETLIFAARLETFQADAGARAHEAARLLERAGAPVKARRLLARLLQDPALPAELREAWQGEADGSPGPGARK
jgi:uncharacterized protein (TIGR03790 family)